MVTQKGMNKDIFGECSSAHWTKKYIYNDLLVQAFNSTHRDKKFILISHDKHKLRFIFISAKYVKLDGTLHFEWSCNDDLFRITFTPINTEKMLRKKVYTCTYFPNAEDCENENKNRDKHGNVEDYRTSPYGLRFLMDGEFKNYQLLLPETWKLREIEDATNKLFSKNIAAVRSLILACTNNLPNVLVDIVFDYCSTNISYQHNVHHSVEK